MQQAQTTARTSWLQCIGLSHTAKVYWQLSPAALIEAALQNKEGVLSDQGALVTDTGKFTGRSSRDKFIVQDEATQDTVWWGPINTPFDPAQFAALYQKVCQYLQDKPLYIRDAHVCALPAYHLSLRIVNTLAWHNLFCHHLFLRPQGEVAAQPDFTLIHVPDFQANPAVDGTHNPNFTIINFTQRILLIGGTGYAGEMKKGIFTVLNYYLPQKHQVLPMHCAANVGLKGDIALFFGLSGTGKTTLATAPQRRLVGDDEHGWYDKGVFNLEGGCYAKTIDLSPEQEPQLFQAIKFGTILENMCFIPGTRTIDYTNASMTENMRSACPITYLPHTVTPAVGNIPQHIFLLTCDAYGVLPPIAKLDQGQAMYHFLAGYTAKIAGTEIGVLAPQAIFSACFGAAFLPLHPVHYAAMFGKKIAIHQVTVWLVNTGWIGGSYGVGQRIALTYTRALLTAALSGALDHGGYDKHPIFGVAMPTACPGVPTHLLNPSCTWLDQAAYRAQAYRLAQVFARNFQQYEKFAAALHL